MNKEKLLIDYLSVMEKIDTIAYSSYKERNKLSEKGFKILDKLVGDPFDYNIINNIIEKTDSVSALLGIAGKIRFDNELLSKKIYEEIGDKDPLPGLILSNWEGDNIMYKRNK